MEGLVYVLLIFFQLISDHQLGADGGARRFCGRAGAPKPTPPYSYATDTGRIDTVKKGGYSLCQVDAVTVPNPPFLPL